MVICVYGAASNDIDEGYMKDCFALGEKLAGRGHSLVYGAGGEGMMGAIARGFKSGGGKVHGVIPWFFEENGYEGIFKSADIITKTETMAERKRVMEDEGEAFVIVPGAIGTLEEFYETLTLKQLGRHKKPIAIYDLNGFYAWVKPLFDDLVKKRFLHPEVLELFTVSGDKDEIINYIENYSADSVKWDILKGNKRKTD